MAETKKVRIRDAKPRDVGLLKKLWKAYLESNETAGSVVCSSEQNLASPAILFERYVSNESNGVVLFIADYAIFMAGESSAPIDYTCGKTATLWGIYVQPGHDVKDQLIAEGFKKLKEKGFDTVLFTSTAENSIELPNAKPLFVTVKVTLE